MVKSMYRTLTGDEESNHISRLITVVLWGVACWGRIANSILLSFILLAPVLLDTFAWIKFIMADFFSSKMALLHHAAFTQDCYGKCIQEILGYQFITIYEHLFALTSSYDEKIIPNITVKKKINV